MGAPTLAGMRLLHTSDWHLGRLFHGVGLRAAHETYVDHLVEVVRSERVGAVLIAGDVYDRAVPSPDTVELLSDAVVRLIDAGAAVVISSGNHDSAIRLGFAAPLLARAGLHIRTAPAAVGIPVSLPGLDIYPIPYLEPSVAAGPLNTEDRTHAGVLRAAMSQVRASALERPAPWAVMAHAFVTGGATSDSERDISVGGVSAVHPDIFDGASYVALGHLHGPQRVGAALRYSGSPVAMSFSEARHTKVTLLVDTGTGSGAARDSDPSVEPIAAPVDRPLATLVGDLEHLLADSALVHAESAYCQVTLTDPVRPVAAMERLRRRFAHTLDVHFDPRGARVIDVGSYAARLATRSDLEVCCDFVAHVRGVPATNDERNELQAALEATRVSAAEDADRGVAPSMARTVA